MQCKASAPELIESKKDRDKLLLKFENLQLNKESDISKYFSKKEILEMPQLKDGKIRMKKNIYEIRYRQLGYNKSFSSKDIKIAKEKFKDFLQELNGLLIIHKDKSTTFEEWAKIFLNDIKKNIISDSTFKLYNKIFKPLNIEFGKLKVKNITPILLQRYFNTLVEAGKTRTAEDVKMLLKQFFETAIANKIIKDNPLDTVTVLKHRRKNGTALTLQEEKEFIKAIENDNFKYAFLFMLYSGVRRAETRLIEKIDLENNLITVQCVKEKGLRKDEKVYRSFPINPKLKSIISNIKVPFNFDCTDLTHRFKEICPNHHLHDLRHTFCSRARECEIEIEVLSIWTGHSFIKQNTLSKVYTHFSIEYQQKEAKKFNYLLE